MTEHWRNLAEIDFGLKQATGFGSSGGLAGLGMEADAARQSIGALADSQAEMSRRMADSFGVHVNPAAAMALRRGGQGNDSTDRELVNTLKELKAWLERWRSTYQNFGGGQKARIAIMPR